MKAKAHNIETKKPRKIKADRLQSAKNAIGAIETGMNTFILTFGQFSLMDAIEHVAESIGPCHIVISTWTAGNADLTRAQKTVEKLRGKSFKMLVDRSFLSRQPKYCQKMIDLFGEGAIRTWRAHAKFTLLFNDKYNIVVRTSMNLNQNVRLENIEISDDKDFCDFLRGVVDEVFKEQKPGALESGLPKLDGVSFEKQNKIQAGVASVGKTK